ncbi:MAG: CHAT domain-containing protein, partial [Merismopedia sp. SIO2A8]|nr:CHAT domain-containing protein [Merismopedia sp. SIO2A8]
YLQSVRSTSQTQSGIDLAAPETQISDRTILVGHKLADLQAIPFTELSDAQLDELEALQAEQQAIIEDFQGFIDSPEIQALIAQLSVEVRLPQGWQSQSQDMVAELDEFINLQNNLQAIDRNAVMIYPLILDDRLELVLVTPFSEPSRYPVEVDRATLNKAIVEFRQALTNPRSQPEASAHQLYQWLIEPMAADLEAIAAETILYAPDGVLRYVPLAALHDGEQWLTQQFAINHITAASLSDFAIADRSEPKVLAAAFSEGFHEVEVGDRTYPFNGLPFAGVEVNNLATLFADRATTFFDTDFSRHITELAMGSHNIVHLATHATFVQGSPSDSFILFGNGDIATLEDIKSWEGRFNQVDLFVLSACETGLGTENLGSGNLDGENLGNGEEILGFGYLMQQAGAKAAIASLWTVDDSGTQTLMDAFYVALNNGHTKTEALQRAQKALITGDESILAGDRRDNETGERGVTIELADTRDTHPGQPLSQRRHLDHPYYWAPFILIGNGL